jgi:uncharacterized membrane protein
MRMQMVVFLLLVWLLLLAQQADRWLGLSPSHAVQQQWSLSGD